MPQDPNRLATDTLIAVRAIEAETSSQSNAVLEKAWAIVDPEARQASLDAWRQALGEASANVDQALATVFRSNEEKLQDALDRTTEAQVAASVALKHLDDIAKTIGTVAKAVALVGQVLAHLP